jgi:hypothetical protein
MLGGDGRQVNEEATWPGQVLINAVTGQVKSVKKHLSGNATYQALTFCAVNSADNLAVPMRRILK